MTSRNLPVVNLWATEYSKRLNKTEPYELTEKFQRLASLFSPGVSFYYVMNMHNLQLEYISPEVEKITGIPASEATIQKLVELSLEDEMENLVKKELVVKDFVHRFLSPESRASYKLVYTYRMRSLNGQLKHMLHQAMMLSFSSEGEIQHIISIHSDVTHLGLPKNNRLSLISLDQNPSYYNLNVDSGVFDPANVRKEESLELLLTPREKEILSLLAKGHSARKISKMLHLSFNTVRTHRKNMLQKAACNNTTELVSRCLMEGVIG